MHVDQLAAAGALMQVIDILSDQQEISGETQFELGQGQMGGVGRDSVIHQATASFVIEFLYPDGVAYKGLGRGDILDIHGRPDAVGIAEGVQPGLPGYPGAGQHDDGSGFRHGVRHAK